MKNIHVLPTDKPSRLYLDRGKLWIDNSVYGSNNQHIYITSDEYIKEGDYFTDDNNSLKRSYKLSHVQFASPKKIILTTDQDLIKNGVQAIDDEFLEWFVKNPSCEFVKVETKITKDGVWTDLKGYVELPTIHSIKYKIIIPKEEQKQHLIDMMRNDEELGLYEEPKKEYKYIGECNGNNGNGCFLDSSGHDCGCFTRVLKEEPKKETTLEEVAHKMLSDYGIMSMGQSIGVLEVKKLMVKMAKWQQERSYSEEKIEFIKTLIDFYWSNYNNEHPNNLKDFELTKRILETFKKK